jgi:hypothetical protein
MTANSPTAAEAKKLNIRINYGGRDHPFHPDADKTVLAVRTEAMDFFDIVADHDRLRLYRLDNTELADGATIGSYNLEKHEVLVLRQVPAGGARC